LELLLLDEELDDELLELEEPWLLDELDELPCDAAVTCDAADDDGVAKWPLDPPEDVCAGAYALVDACASRAADPPPHALAPPLPPPPPLTPS